MGGGGTVGFTDFNFKTISMQRFKGIFSCFLNNGVALKHAVTVFFELLGPLGPRAGDFSSHKRGEKKRSNHVFENALTPTDVMFLSLVVI